MHILQTLHKHSDIITLAEHFNDGNLRTKDEALSFELYFRGVQKSRTDLITAKAFPTRVIIFDPTMCESPVSSDTTEMANGSLTSLKVSTWININGCKPLYATSNQLGLKTDLHRPVSEERSVNTTVLFSWSN